MLTHALLSIERHLQLLLQKRMPRDNATVHQLRCISAHSVMPHTDQRTVATKTFRQARLATQR